LRELFEDIKEKKIDIVLAYKIDRVARFPKDFCCNDKNLIPLSQQRLLRNLMLTFIQFELN